MKVRFWGVRGSIPTPLTPDQLKSKISAIVGRIRPQDLATGEAREIFLASLPEDLFGTVGGNTPCLEVVGEEGDCIILDGGTGLRELGLAHAREKAAYPRYHIIFSHFHWDHIQGLPFFPVNFMKDREIRFYSIEKDLEALLRDQMKPPYFPVTLDVLRCAHSFHQLAEDGLVIGNTRILHRPMNHPGGCTGFAVVRPEGKFVYATDTELSEADFKETPENRRFFAGAKLLVMDSQYTLGEAIEKYSWGHSSFSMACDFAAAWKIGTLALFHHEPTYNDKKIHTMLKEAQWYLDHREDRGNLRVVLAREGMEFDF